MIAWRRQERMARLMLAPLVIIAFLVAIYAPGHAVWGVDSRTYLEMTVGIATRGLPAIENGPSSEFSEMRAPFNVPSHGLLWGEYPPLFPYVSALFLKLDGVSGFHRTNLALACALAFAVYGLARRLGRSPLLAAGAAWASVVGVPVWTVAYETPAMPLMMLLVTLSILCGAHALESGGKRARRYAALAGALGGFAVGAHLLAVLMAFAVIVVLAVSRRGRPLGIDRERITRFVYALACFSIPIGLLALLNVYRFGNPNPISYPCVWKHCTWNVQNSLRMGELASFAAPLGACLVVTALVFFIVRRRPTLRWYAFLVAVLALLPWTMLRERALTMVQTLRGFLVDVPTSFGRNPNFSWAFTVPDDGIGVMNDHHVVRALFQVCPAAAIGLLALRERARGPVLLAFAAVAGLVAELATLARFDGMLSLGWPFLFTRYAIPAAPILLALATIPASRFRFDRWCWIGLVVALPVLVYLVLQQDDHPLLTRVILLWLPLLIATVALATCVWGPDGIAAKAVAVAAFVSMAITIGADARTTIHTNQLLDAKIRPIEGISPIALVGWGPDLDPALAVRATADVQYVDLTESESWSNMRILFDRWAAEGRPVYGYFPTNGTFRWPYADWDVPAREIDQVHGLWQIGPPRRRVHDPVP